MKKIFPFICCGSVDDGKSTLIGRLLLKAGAIKKDQIEDAQKASLKNGSSQIELSMLLDGLIIEREQQITVDIAHRYFDYNDIRFHILDCPGHEQYTQNMAIAAAMTDTAIMVIDCKKGIQLQTKRHLDICNLFRIKNLCICITKCDLVMDDSGELDNKIIDNLKNEIKKLMLSYSFNYNVITVSALKDYKVDCVLDCIYQYANKEECNNDIIYHIQASRIYNTERYYYARSINKNKLKIGNKYTIYPQGNIVSIKDIISLGCFTINEDIDITQGDCLTNKKMYVSNKIYHKTIWFSQPVNYMLLKHGCRVCKIINFSENTIELDKPLIFNDIDDVKQNAYGIVIDNITKKTIGCCVFINNNKNENDYSSKIFDLRNVDSSEKTNQFNNIKNQFSLPPLILDSKKIKDYINLSDIDNSMQKIAEPFREQGYNVIII